MFIVKWIPAICWMGVIFYLSSRTGSDLQSMFPIFDSLNFGHVIAYFVLALLFYWALYQPNRNKLTIRLVAIFLCFLYGLTDEWHQSFVPGRAPDWRDIVNDVLGASLAMIALRFYRRK